MTQPIIASEKPVFTHRQMCDMMSITRSWTLNNPSGPLPHLPKNIDEVEFLSELGSTMPEFKKPHWILKLLIKLKIV